MTLQSSGAISLNEIHVEAGGSSGSLASINDADIRALISKGSAVQMSFSEWYGASATSNWTSVLTTGVQKNNVGFSVNSYGSMTDRTIDTYSNRAIANLNYSTLSSLLIFTMPGAPNSGWTSIKIHNTTFNRTSASTFFNGGYTFQGVSNPFGTTSAGVNRTIEFII